jgi:hypothetical protein
MISIPMEVLPIDFELQVQETAATYSHIHAFFPRPRSRFALQPAKPLFNPLAIHFQVVILPCAA